MKRLGFTIVKNTLANGIRGGATAVVALTLPHFLTRSLDHERFAAWALMLQIAAYASYLDFGLQTAVARYLAQDMERGDDEHRDLMVSTALAMLATGGAFAFLLIGIVACKLPQIFHGLSPYLVGELRSGVLVLAATSALLLPMSAFTGVLIGLHRNEYPAMAIGGTRILGALAVLICVRYTQSLFWLAVCIGGCNLIGGLLQYLMVRRVLPSLQIALRGVSATMAAELARYCSTLVLLSFGMLLISGLDVTIVGHFDFGAVGYYSIAVTVISFLTGLNSSLFNAMLTPVTVLQERHEYERIRSLVLATTRLNTYTNLLLYIGVVIAGPLVLRVWVGSSYASAALPILEVLMFAQAIRLVGSSYSIVLLAMGQQKRALFPGMIEAFSNLLFSIVGMMWFGPIGVAWGTLVSAVLGLAVYITWTLPCVPRIPLGRLDLLLEGVGRPLVCLMPLLLYIVITRTRPTSPLTSVYLVAALTCVFLWSWKWGKLLPARVGSE